MKIKITIEGPQGAGKTTIAEWLQANIKNIPVRAGLEEMEVLSTNTATGSRRKRVSEFKVTYRQRAVPHTVSSGNWLKVVT